MSESRVERWIHALRQRHEAGVSIDDIGEIIGTDLATTEDIDALFVGLEALGVSIRIERSTTPPAQLRAVLSSARTLKEQGVRPTPENIARALEVSVSEVRAALLYARVLSR